MPAKTEDRTGDVASPSPHNDAYRETAAYSRCLLETCLDPLVTISAAGKITDVNKATEKITGVDRSVLIGTDFADYFTDPEKARAGYRQAFEQGQVTDYPLRLRHLSGTVAEVQYNASVYRNEGGEVLGVFASARDITALKRLQEALHENELRLREVLENSLDASYKRNILTDTYEYLSPVFTRLSGYTPDEMKAFPIETVLSLIHPDDLDRIERVIAESMSGADGTSYELEYRFKHRDGRYRWFQDRFTVLRNGEGKAVARIGSVRDITRRRETEEALRESEDNLNAVFNATDESMFLLAADGTLLALNNIATQRMGVVVIGEKALDLLPRETAAHRRTFIQQALTTGDLVIFEDERNGRWMANRVQPIHDAAGRVSRLAVYSRDITEQRSAEDALRLFKRLVESSEEAIAVSNPAGGLVYINPAHEKLFGRTLEQARQMNYRDYYPPESIEVLNSVVAPMVQAGESWEGELDAFDSAGRRFPLWERAGSVRDDDGRMLYGFGLMHDITERRKAEEALRESHWRMGSIIEATHAGTWQWNVQTGEATISALWAEILGYSPDEMAPLNAKSWRGYVHSDDLKQSDELMARHLAGELPYYDCEYRMCHKDGHWVWVHNCGRVTTRTDDGRPLLMFGTQTDVTGRKLAEEDLRKALKEVRTLSGIVPICANCKKIRDDQGYWEQVEVYISDHTEAEFSHGICPECMKALYPELE